MKQLAIVVFALALFVAPVAAQPDAPTPTYSAAVLETQMAYEAAVDALPVVDVLPAIEVTESPEGDTIINIDTQPDADPAVEPPAPPSVPADTVHVALVVGGIIAVAVIGVAAFLLKTTGDQLYNSLPPIAQYGVRAGGEYLLSKAATTPQEDDDAAIESALRLLGFTVIREEDGTITLRRSAPVVQGPMTPVNTAISAQTPPSTAGMPPGQWVFVQTPTAPQQPSVEAVRQFTEGDTPTVDEPAA